MVFADGQNALWITRLPKTGLIWRYRGLADGAGALFAGST